MAGNMKPTPNKSKFSPWIFWASAIMIIVVINFLSNGSSLGNSKQLTLYKFNEYLEQGKIDKVEFGRTVAKVYIKESSLSAEEQEKLKSKSIFGQKNEGPQYLVEIGTLDLFQQKLDAAAKEKLINDFKSEPESNWGDLIVTFLPIIIIIGFWLFMMRRMTGGAGGGAGGGQIFSIGKSKAKMFDEKNDVRVTFEDVAGLEGAKEEIVEIVEFLKNPTKYTSIGGKIPKGALLVGPPGTGKTLLAKAVAGEAKVPFFSLSGSDFVEMFVGVGASRVRDLFKQAKEKSPAIIFIDEIDAVGRARGKSNFSGSNDERENTLNQLLTEMDGFGSNTNVIVLAATNRAEILDKALLRAGRFDRQIYVDLPDVKERQAIFNVHLRNIKKVDNLDIDFLAKQTPGFSGADIANVCNEAALTAARKDKTEVDMQDFLDAVDRIIGGLEKKNKIISPEEKYAIAIHEAGHATVSWMCEHAAPLVKVTIVPRGQSLGAAWYLPAERQIVRTEQMLDEMCATMGGRAAEKIIFDKISTGALSDLEKVSKQAKAMVTVYGLNDKIGNVTYYDSSGQSEYNFGKPYSEDTARVIDEEISKLIEGQYQRAIEILTTHKSKLTQLADVLCEKEVIFKEDLERIFGKRPFDKEIVNDDADETLDVNPSELES
ncbi:MAG: ATP-dependent zinc metalloprotease FtsH [Flavobacteriaceae bacterium]|jgi:cell division protease FtsH|nr:ATP-dependent zinc metalloprotease FtsH [Flavobacteriaceae bacterium]